LDASVTRTHSRTRTGPLTGVLGVLLVVLLVLGDASGGQAGPADPADPAGRTISEATTQTAARPAYVPRVGHVFVVNIENKSYDATWGPDSKAPYLSKTLRGKGVLLSNYYGTAHNSLPNYLAQISGQGPNPQGQADCQIFSVFTQLTIVAPGQAVGTGCVFPTGVRSLPVQLSSRGISWRGYMDGMTRACQHPPIGERDPTQVATETDNYAVRHNPFMYFQAIIGRPTYCAKHVVPLTRLSRDLGSVRTTPRFSYLTPDLCHDGHDTPCADGRPGGLVSVDAWMRAWIPKILASPAYRRDGMLVITADESTTPFEDASACCGEGPAPNSALPGIVGLGGGRVGTLVISRWTSPHTSSTTAYNHYSLLASLEELFGVPKLGYARTADLNRFHRDVYNNGWVG